MCSKVEVEKKYSLYKIEFIDGSVSVNGKRVGLKTYPMIDGKCGTFFHIISKGVENSHRELIILPCKECKFENPCLDFHEYNPLLHDLREKRAICPERLEKIDYLVDFFTTPHLKIWEKEHPSKKGVKKRVLFYNEEKNYLVVLEDREIYYILWTAYPVGYESRKEKLLKEYKKATYKK